MTHATRGSFPSLFSATPSGHVVCMRLATAVASASVAATAPLPERNSVGRHCLSWNSAPLLSHSLSPDPRFHLLLPLPDKPLLIYLLNNTTAVRPLPRLCLVAHSSLNGLPRARHFRRRRKLAIVSAAGVVESCGPVLYGETRGMVTRGRVTTRARARKWRV